MLHILQERTMQQMQWDLLWEQVSLIRCGAQFLAFNYRFWSTDHGRQGSWYRRKRDNRTLHHTRHIVEFTSAIIVHVASILGVRSRWWDSGCGNHWYRVCEQRMHIVKGDVVKKSDSVIVSPLLAGAVALALMNWSSILISGSQQ